MRPAKSEAAVLRHRGLRLVGVLNLPAGRKGRRHPAVLFLHGFPGTEKNVDVQRELQRRGVGSLALHFAGAWGSEGLYRPSALVPQARAALRWLSSRPFIDSRRLGVFGFSMGGWTALNLLPLEPRLRAAVAVAPVGGPEMVRPGTRERLERLGRPLRTGSAGALLKDFVRSVNALDPAKSAARPHAPLLLVHGDKDDVVPLPIGRRILAHASPPVAFVLARGARHDFLDRRPWLVRLTADWLIQRLR